MIRKPQLFSTKKISVSVIYMGIACGFNSLHEDRVGTEKKEAVPFNTEEEEQLWLKNMSNVETPAGSQKPYFSMWGSSSTYMRQTGTAGLETLPVQETQRS